MVSIITAVICTSALLIMFILLSISSVYKRRYRKKLKRKINKSEHPLYCIYGLSFLIIDKLNEKNIRLTNKKIDVKLKKIYAKEEIREEQYLYASKKLAGTIAIIGITFAIGSLIGFSEYKNNRKQITTVERNMYGEGEKQYSLNVKDSENMEEITINVSQKKLTIDECHKILNEEKDNIVKKILDDNKDLNHVDRKLNFISTYGKYDIHVRVNTNNSDLINYDGNILRDVSEGGELVELNITLELNQVSIEHTVFVCVTGRDISLTNKEVIEKQINEDEFSREVKLPEKINGDKVIYYGEQEHTSGIISVLGLMASIFVFVFMDKELDKKIKERNIQMIKDYPDIVSKVLLYNKAGLSIRNSLEKIYGEYDSEKKYRFAYEELGITINKMNSGINEIKAIEEFGKRSGVHCYIKFANIICQNIKRGSKEMDHALNDEIENACLERKLKSINEGKEAGVKLLGPMILMLIISMAIIIAPALLSMHIN